MSLLCFSQLLKKTLLVVVLWIIALNVFCAPSSPALPTSPTSSTINYTFKDLGWDKSVTLNGYNPNRTLYLPITNTPRPDKAILHLKVIFSQLLTEKTRLEIKFNQTLLRTLSGTGNTVPITMDIELPLTDLSPDWQGLSFNAYLNSSETLCNPNVWIYIAPESNLTLTTPNTPFAGSLNQVIPLFLNTSTINPISPLILLPSTPSLTDIFSSLYVAMRFGQLTNSDKIDINTHFIDESTEELNKHHLVLIGTENELKDYPPYSMQIDHSIQDNLKENDGVILLTQSPFNSLYGLLTFTGIDENSLNKAVSAFLISEFKNIISGQFASIKKVHVAKNIEFIGNWYHTTLSKLNYDDKTVSGLGHHKLSYTIQLPNDRTPSEMTIKTVVTSPAADQYTHSQIILLINGQKQALFALNKEHSLWTAHVDANVLKPGINTIDYIIDLHLEHEDCSLQNYDQVWATIHKETELTATFQKEFPFATLNQLPVPFSSTMNFIIPDKLSREQISNLGTFFFRLGQLIPYNSISVKFYNAHQVDEEFIRTQNVILYGTPNTNPWVTFALGYMPIQLNNNDRILNVRQSNIELGNNSSTGLLELMASPWSSNKAVLIITGTDDSALKSAVEQFINKEQRLKLDGNIALINSDGSVEILNSNEGRYISIQDKLIRFITNKFKDISFYVQYHLELFIYLLVFVVPLGIYFKRRKRKG